MKTKCPHCNGKYDVDHRSIGQQVKCPDCKNLFEIENDNLYPCPDCFSLISKRASLCPKCGAPLNKQSASPAYCQDAPDDISAEQAVEVYHPSPMSYFWIIIFGVITIPVFLIGVAILLYVVIEVTCTSYELTTRRIIVRKGWISKSQNEIWIKDIRGVNLVQSIWQRIIGVGDIGIGTAASAGIEISISGVANPAGVVAEIDSLRK